MRPCSLFRGKHFLVSGPDPVCYISSCLAFCPVGGWVGHCLVKTLPAFCRLPQSPSESQKLPFFLPEVLLTHACALVVVGTCSSWRNDLTGPSRIPRVPGGGEGRRHIPSPGVIAPSEWKVALEPRDLPGPPFLMGRLRRREVEQRVCRRSARRLGLGLLLRRPVLFLGDCLGEWVFLPDKGS